MTNQGIPRLTKAEPRFFYGYVIVIVAFLIQMLMYGSFYSFGVFFKPLAAEFDWSRAVTSGAFSAKMLMGGIFSIVMGRLNDRLGPRIVLTVGGLFLGLGYLLMSQINALWQLYLFYAVLVAIGMSTGWVPLVSTIARWFVKSRGLTTGIVVSGVGAGTLIVPPIANWLIANYGWRTSYLLIGGVTLVVIVLAAQFLRRDPKEIGLSPYGGSEVSVKGRSEESEGLSLLMAVRNRQFWMIGVIFFCFTFCIQTIMLHIVPHTTELGISTTIAASVLAIIGGASIAGRIAMGGLADRLSNRRPLFMALVLAAIALFYLQPANQVWMFYLFAIAFGFAYGGLPALMSPIAAELFGLGSLGVILGSLGLMSTMGGAIGPVLAGHIFDTTSSYSQAFLLCAILAVIGAGLTWFLRSAKQPESTNT